MARVMLVIRKIVDRRPYNRANIIDPIPTYPPRRLPSLVPGFSLAPTPATRSFLFLRHGGRKI